MNNGKVIGYLPDERPPVWKLILYSLQQVVVMFPATILVALITGFHVSTTVFASGFATICFILVTGGKIPLYYGSSFSYLPAIASLMMSKEWEGMLHDTKISYIQFGIIMSGVISILAGLLIKLAGKKVIDKILPATVTGPVAIIIGISLAGNAIKDASFDSAIGTTNDLFWIVSGITLLATIIFSVYLKGILGQISLLLGPIVGCIVAFIVQEVSGVPLFRALPDEVAATMGSGVFAVPHFTLPKVSWGAVAAIMPIALATIPESTAHVYQLDIYVNDLAKKKKNGKKYNIADKLWLNLVGDGIGDMVSASMGGPAGTNYGENISAMAITKVFSTPVLIGAAIIAMLISFFTPLISALYAIPQAVIGGLEIYLFGAITAQGVAIMIDRKVDMFSSRNIAVIATILVLGIGGHYAYDGYITIGSIDLPCIAFAAIFGILLNLFLSIGQKNSSAPVEAEQPTVTE
ncbi:MAG: solute carrier family 23 protein [Eubacteriales bacterium]|nr:solute carrier family 23 protein [Eubacteriales bacterium]MDD4475142.1 solute carrier family 23 protein [Eubacteriales bacterium]